MASPAHAQWKVAETEHFRLYGRISDTRLRQHLVRLEDYHRLLAEHTGRDGPTPRLDIFLVGNMAEGWPFSPAIRSSPGYYRATPNGIAAVVADTESAQRILFHHVAHHFMYSRSGAVYPTWYIEGFAQYFESALLKPNRVEIGRVSENNRFLLARNPWLPLDMVLGRRLRPNVGGNLPLFYGQSWLLTHYLFQSPSQTEHLAAYLQAVGQGADPVEAFRTHIDPDLVGFNARLADYLLQQTPRRLASRSRPRDAAPAAAVTITRMPRAANDLLLPMITLEHMTERNQDLLPVATRVVSTAAARHPQDPLAERALALLALRSGERDEAMARLDRLIAAAPADATQLRWQAEAISWTTADTQARAIDLLDRSLALDPSDWRTLRARALAAGARTQKIGDADLDLLVRAWQLAPQVAELAVDLGTALVHAGRADEAVIVLAPLANAPHGGWQAERAARLLAAVHDRSAFLAILDER